MGRDTSGSQVQVSQLAKGLAPQNETFEDGRRRGILRGMKSQTCASPTFRILCGVILSLGLSAISARANEANRPLSIQLGGEPSTLDPAMVIDQYGIGILRNVVEGLFRLDAEGRLENGLVESYQVSKDNLRYRFRLRTDAKWSDGIAVRPEDFIAGLRRALDPKTASPNSGFFFAIQNAKAVFAGKMPPDKLGISIEKGELVIQLDRVDPTFLYELTLPTAGPIRQDLLDAAHGKWNTLWPVTGDFQITVNKPAELIELTPNPVKSKSQQKIIYRILPEEVTALNLFDAGRLDVITTIPPTEIARLRKKNLIQMIPSTTVFYLSFNMSKAPFSQPDWRRAIASSIDRDGLIKVLNGQYLPITSLVPPPLEGAPSYHAIFDPAVISEIKNIQPKPRVRLAYGASAFTKLVTEKLQSDLRQKLGLTVELEPMELKTLLARLQSDPPEMYFLGMSAMFDDPMNQLNAFSNFSDPTYSHYNNPEYEKLCDAIRMTPKGEKRTGDVVRANQILTDRDAAVVPLVLRNQVFGVNKNLQGFHVSPYQVIQLNALSRSE